MTPVAPQLMLEREGAAITAYQRLSSDGEPSASDGGAPRLLAFRLADSNDETETRFATAIVLGEPEEVGEAGPTADDRDRKSTRLNSSHVAISYAVFCLKKKNTKTKRLDKTH